jgi:hypothetical protein
MVISVYVPFRKHPRMRRALIDGSCRVRGNIQGDQFQCVPCEPHAVVPRGAWARVDVHLLWPNFDGEFEVLAQGGECTGSGGRGIR